ncbi:hypothetical protein [Chryseobacterium sp. MFBS3-17]|uniref:hypothetical protein n=1 Tax=Chryseobacterium sp. MFBS3-17 TaxID=2886689 RepID=UPI001D0E1FF1|nr:hypothetical protein [Chryseobacterium sp. MFBS3-17]MCC2590350.1 hypothetical protein [Chryseobacterium sp. MFBS3-17]
MEKLFELLQMQPAISIICISVLALALVWILRHQIVSFVKKRYNLYDADEIQQSLNLTDNQIKKLKK